MTRRRTTYGILSVIMLLISIGIVGGVQNGTSLVNCIWAMAALLLFGLFAWLAGAME